MVFFLTGGGGAILPLFGGGQEEGLAGGSRARSKYLIKLASLVPEATPWGEALNKMAEQVGRDTNGAMEIKIYHNGVAGNESEVLRLLQGNSIQLAVLTSFGLNTITPEILTLSYPFLIRNDAELDAVLERVKPELEGKINSKGFRTIAWSKVGFINIFSRYNVRTPDDVRKTKVGSSESENDLINVFKTLGYQMYPITIHETLLALQTGRIDTIYTSPLIAANLQIFGVTKYFMNFPICPYMGGIFMNNLTWESLPPEYQEIILKRAAEAEASINTALKDLEEKAIDT